MAQKKRESGFPYDAAPDVNDFPGEPESCFDLVNRYGTYNVQRTTDTNNIFPLIGPALPKAWKKKELDKEDLEKTE